MNRRALLQAAAAVLAGGPWLARAQQRVPIADVHSHYGMVTRRQLAESGFADDLRNNGVVLVAWKLVADGPWLRSTSTGIEQASEPRPGALAEFFNRSLARMDPKKGSSCSADHALQRGQGPSASHVAPARGSSQRQLRRHASTPAAARASPSGPTYAPT